MASTLLTLSIETIEIKLLVGKSRSIHNLSANVGRRFI
ncbi:hypothetical protein I876_04390 [Alteromonas mediterranea U7]|uniref:Uncharacterized protein n=2 Tax=Alteromonas mediterranea TaxID=314275 RepID=S5AKI3_9ALTE|nr:hypothetical protein MADE_1004545 [Alteromonas mediterranea DE]AGP77123.1 hypothetical protein I633_04405 [Alteromonas mediterranea 615]AGP84644.1 hypothetical protein I607_04180 [Alteromonas mediterranea U4]AGP88759.1 hypothetical protein I876_04390 [Alteromonas mediterranea U7]AGP92642.1 hypothetical protein I634_04540 [Alteromonas mediterranea U8]